MATAHGLRRGRARFGAVGRVCAVLVLLAAASPAYAQEPLDDIVRVYRDSTAAIEGSLRTYALVLFGLLAGAEFAYAGIRLAFKGADFGEWLAELTNQILFIGFFLSLLLFSGDWASAVVDSFRQAGNQASLAAGGGSNLAPSQILGIGIDLANRVIDESSVLRPMDSLGFIIAALILLICFAFIALFMIEALVQSYIIISAGALFMGFGGARWTKDFAVKIITAAVGVGAKLFMLQLLVGLGDGMMRRWLETSDTMTYRGIFVMIGAALVMLGLTKSIPDLVQSLINGSAFQGGGGLLGAAAAAGGAAGGFAGGMAGAGFAVAGASRLASEQLASRAATGGGAPSSLGRLAALTGGTVRNLGAAAVEDVGAKLGGRAHHGSMPGRMGDRLHSEAKLMRADRERQSVASDGGAGASGDGGHHARSNGNDSNGGSPDGDRNTIGPE